MTTARMIVKRYKNVSSQITSVNITAAISYQLRSDGSTGTPICTLVNVVLENHGRRISSVHFC